MVTFEVPLTEIVGMEYTNTLIEHSSRFVFEARTIIKKSFDTPASFSNHYNLDICSSSSTSKNSYYTPKLDRLNQTLDIDRVYPFNKQKEPPKTSRVLNSQRSMRFESSKKDGRRFDPEEIMLFEDSNVAE